MAVAVSDESRDDKPNLNITVGFFPHQNSSFIPLILVLSQWNTRHLLYSLIFYRILRTENTDASRNPAAESMLERGSRIFRFRALIYDSSWNKSSHLWYLLVSNHGTKRLSIFFPTSCGLLIDQCPDCKYCIRPSPVSLFAPYYRYGVP